MKEVIILSNHTEMMKLGAGVRNGKIGKFSHPIREIILSLHRNKKCKVMTVISAQEFVANRNKYFDMAINQAVSMYLL
jgi:hypothetical protein